MLRVEALPESWFEYNNAFTTVTEFYAKTANFSSTDIATSDAANSSDAMDTSDASGERKTANGTIIAVSVYPDCKISLSFHQHSKLLSTFPPPPSRVLALSFAT